MDDSEYLFERKIFNAIYKMYPLADEDKELIDAADDYGDQAFEHLANGEEPKLLEWLRNDPELIKFFATTTSTIFLTHDRVEKSGYPIDLWMNNANFLLARMVQAIAWRAVINDREMDLSIFGKK